MLESINPAGGVSSTPPNNDFHTVQNWASQLQNWIESHPGMPWNVPGLLEKLDQLLNSPPGSWNLKDAINDVKQFLSEPNGKMSDIYIQSGTSSVGPLQSFMDIFGGKCGSLPPPSATDQKVMNFRTALENFKASHPEMSPADEALLYELNQEMNSLALNGELNPTTLKGYGQAMASDTNNFQDNSASVIEFFKAYTGT